MCRGRKTISSSDHCPSGPEYLVTPQSSKIPRNDALVLTIAFSPIMLVAVILILLQCFHFVRHKRHLRDWQAHIEEATQQQQTFLTMRQKAKREQTAGSQAQCLSFTQCPGGLDQKRMGQKINVNRGE
eukprot:Blabericola_migrator_1__8480@NODE_441_length_8449_cov_49_535552_g346_i0_p10_GENE_NODE_441_length_8449_cov_49_535552_g346_i0NODE_441_length_8449_cov_49_535552_g346_i0_p10_ORF_typecomplete_len128_score19_22TMEM51/PF15345_6/0_0012EcsB/PF05975_12/0_0014stn_TNFRSF12A/PF12191_8/0_0089DAG1/PF05454_11/0_027Comm/PF15957_5/0_034Cpta_toxin/PF07254_12/0_035ASFV_J13L/PF05568_11/0_045Herpes_gE/PF02480_16/0_042DUF4834/PF16118_5/0_065WBP1/PF11669_8/0_094Bac_transf/PF02397_16/0_14FTR1/PF03239_14/0_17MLANA/PF1499